MARCGTQNSKHLAVIASRRQSKPEQVLEDVLSSCVFLVIDERAEGPPVRGFYGSTFWLLSVVENPIEAKVWNYGGREQTALSFLPAR